MRLLPAALLAAALAGGARAGDEEKCVEEGLMLFPAPGAVVPTNSRFILEGIGPDQERVWDLIGQELALRTQDDTVRLTVLKGWKSEAGRAAVILKPRALLKANRSYRLDLGKLSGSDVVNGASPGWTTGKAQDQKGPKWLERPNVAEGQYRTTASGKKIKLLRFRMRANEESPTYLVLSIRRARGPVAVQSYFVPIQGEQALVGHDACSGSFTFDDGRAYRAIVEGYDVAGNPAEKLKPIEFHAPRPVFE